MTDLLPDALADALGRVVSDLRKEWSKDLERIDAESRAVSAEFRAKLVEVLAGVKAQVDQVVADARARAEVLKDGAPGKDGRDGAEGPAGPQGEKGEIGITGETGELGPPGERGLQGIEGKEGPAGPHGADGRDGKDAQIRPDQIAGEVFRYLEANPPKQGDAGVAGANGKDGAPGERGMPGEPGRDGRDGLPGVPGGNGDKGRDGLDGKDGSAGLNGKDGADGLGFDDMMVEHDGERAITLRFVRGAESKEFPITMPIVLDRGVYRDGQTYQRGDGVSWAGSFWIAQDETAEKPDTGKGWRMAVKRGRDGKEGLPGKSALPPPVVRADR